MEQKAKKMQPEAQTAALLAGLEARLAEVLAQLQQHQRDAFVAVVAITWGKRILTVYNEKWRSFTLPMTKQREWLDPAFPGRPARREDWVHAAARAATEWLGGLVTTKASAEEEKPRFHHMREVLIAASLSQGDRDGLIKKYNFRVYQMDFERKPKVHMDSLTKWLTVEEILDSQLQPISDTARFLVSSLDENARKQNKSFP